MKTSSSTFLTAKGHICYTVEHQLTPTERSSLCAIAKGLGDFRPGNADFRNGDDRLDETKTVSQKACWHLFEAGLLYTDPMAYHGYQFNITPLGLQMVDKLNGKGV